MQRRNIRGFYYLTHINNIPSILKRGILSHKKVEDENIKFTPIFDSQIVTMRKDKKTPNGKSLWEFANFYFQSRNPMLYRVVCEKGPNNIAILGIKRDILDYDGVYITTGNAASRESEILSPSPQGFAKIKEEVLKMEWWKEVDGTKRKIMAECLVPNSIPPEMIQTIIVSNSEMTSQLQSSISNPKLPIMPAPGVFFQPSDKILLAKEFYLVQGDMFFSRQQTLTISVNTVGVMGRGVASRAKYQFPDVYVYYQDLCKKKILKMGEPILYKREVSFDHELAEDPTTMTNANAETWFLLFPTKRHWKEPADINGIKKGLEWLKVNYKRKGIKSLAIPALGCGLGWLSWNTVGPVICKILSTFDIPIWLYLPAEKTIPREELTKEFLLGD